MDFFSERVFTVGPQSLVFEEKKIFKFEYFKILRFSTSYYFKQIIRKLNILKANIKNKNFELSNQRLFGSKEENEVAGFSFF